MDAPQSKVTIKQKRFIIDKFLKMTNQSTKLYPSQMKILNGLVEQYTVDDILYTLDYLSAHPPREGLRSLAYLPYVIDRVLAQRRSEGVLERIEANINRDMDVTSDLSNQQRYQSQARKGVKGTVKF